MIRAVLFTSLVAGATASQLLPDPLEMLPPGVAGGVAAAVRDETPYTLNLMPPSESSVEQNGLIDSYMAIESGHERAMEASAVAAKQRLLNAEIAKVHSIVAGHNSRSAFLQRSVYSTLAPKADHTFVLHPPAEDKAAIDAAANSILKVEAAKAASAAKADAELKQQLLNREISKIGDIVRGAFH